MTVGAIGVAGPAGVTAGCVSSVTVRLSPLPNSVTVPLTRTAAPTVSPEVLSPKTRMPSEVASLPSPEESCM
jgi:hypothetical protein